MKWCALAVVCLTLLLPGNLLGQQSVNPTQPQPARPVQSTPTQPAQPQASQSAAAPEATPTETIDEPLITWRISTGETFPGSLVEFDVEKKEIVLEGAEKQRVRVATRSLDGPSKVQWLKSPITMVALQQSYPWKDYATKLLMVIAGALGGGIVLGFVFFWLAVSIIAGDGNLIKAIKSYILANLGVLLVYAIWVGVVLLLVSFMSEFKAMPFLIAGFGILLVLGSMGVFCRVIGTTYDVSGCAGCGVLMLWSVFFTVLEIAFYFSWPMLMGEQGFDEWLSKLVLEPLGLI